MKQQTQDRDQTRIAELTAQVDRLGGAGTADRALAAELQKQLAACADLPSGARMVGKLKADGLLSGSKVAVLHRTLGELIQTKPTLPTIPTAPTVPTVTSTAPAMAPKPAQPSAELLGSLIAGVFGTGVRQQLDIKPLTLDPAFTEAAARVNHSTYAAEQARKAYKPQAGYTEQERFAKYRQFLFSHHLSVPGLDFSGCGEPGPSPLTQRQQETAERLTSEFLSTVEGKNTFGYSPAARAAREYLRSTETKIKA